MHLAHAREVWNVGLAVHDPGARRPVGP
jgi:hypothetical protein